MKGIHVISFNKLIVVEGKNKQTTGTLYLALSKGRPNVISFFGGNVGFPPLFVAH